MASSEGEGWGEKIKPGEQMFHKETDVTKMEYRIFGIVKF